METAPIVEQFHAGVLTDDDGNTLPFRLFIPKMEPGQSYPLLLFLHGSGENARDNVKQLRRVVTLLTPDAVQQRYPHFILAPQLAFGQAWSASEAYMGSKAQAPITSGMRLAMALIFAIQRQFPSIDHDRLYLGGLSSGASGTWDFIERQPDLFAAAIPVSGSGDAGKAGRLVHLPIWAFHGANDIITLPSTTTTMIEAITKAGGHPRMTLFSDAGHRTWDKVFTDPTVLAWLFTQHRTVHHPQ